MKRIATLTLLLAACSDEPVILATIPASTTSDAGGRVGDKRCTRTDDCGSGQYCKKHGCSETAGNCEPYPALCGDEEQVVCGCDGVTYFNECLRRAAGIAEAHDGECEADAVQCGGPGKTACPGSATCATLLGSDRRDCHDAMGSCWVVPVTCPTPTHADRWDECEPLGRRCVDTCEAIRSGKSYFRASTCQ